MAQEKKTIQKRKGDGRAFRVYWRYTRRYPWLLVAISVGLCFLEISALLYPLFLRQFFNTLSLSHPGDAVVHSLVVTLALISAMWFLDWLGRRIQDPAVARLEASAMADLISDAFDYLMEHSYNFFISNFAGSLTHKINKYSRSYEVLFDSVIIQFVPTLIFVVGAVAILFAHNHVLGTALGIWSVCFVLFQIWVSKLRQPVRAARAEADTRVTRYARRRNRQPRHHYAFFRFGL